jgi:hypothetical protein
MFRLKVIVCAAALRMEQEIRTSRRDDPEKALKSVSTLDLRQRFRVAERLCVFNLYWHTPRQGKAICSSNFSAARWYYIEYRTTGIEDGVERWVAARSRSIFADENEPIHLIGAVVDTTDLKRAEAGLRGEVAKRTVVEDVLRQSRKIEAVGQFAGGFANEFNNMVAVVIRWILSVSALKPVMPRSGVTSKVPPKGRGAPEH